jgi:cell division protein FtsI (penicillin-binding protein 3)
MKRTAKTTVGERARWRSALLLVGFALCAVALEGRILYLQLVDKDFLAEQVNDRHLRTVAISARRGSLTDRHGEPLAVSTPVDTIYANPKELKSELDRLDELASVLDLDEQWLARRITSNVEREFVFLKRRVLPVEAEKVLALDLPGVGTMREDRRYYPAGEVAAHVVGFTDVAQRICDRYQQ